MELSILKKALEYYVLSAECSNDDRQKVFDAIAECNELAERFIDRKLWKDIVYLVTSGSLSDLLNQTTYDDFGKLARTHGHNVPFEYYTHKVRQYFLQDMTNRSLQLGYDVIRDLWIDNEDNGCHNADGTFKHNNQQSVEESGGNTAAIYDDLQEIVRHNFLRNEGVLDQEEIDKCNRLLAYADLMKSQR